jgi:hypothetical protein
MSLLTESAYDDRQLERYLLGLLPDEDAEHLDELSISDDKLAGRLLVVEDDLVDAYVSGELAGETLERFESFYLSSERRRQKVRFARSFLLIDRGAGPAGSESGREPAKARAAERPGVSRKKSSLHLPFLQQSRPAWSFAVAAALLIALGGPLLYEVVRLRGDLNEARLASADLSQRARDLQQQLDERTARIEAGDSARPTDPPPAPTRALPVIALILLPQTRGIGPITTLAVPQGVDRVALELRLESSDFPRYQVTLTDPATNGVVWRSDRIAPGRADDVPTVPVVIPASVLKAQHYSLELNGLGANGDAEVAGSYAFQVVRR